MVIWNVHLANGLGLCGWQVSSLPYLMLLQQKMYFTRVITSCLFFTKFMSIMQLMHHPKAKQLMVIGNVYLANSLCLYGWQGSLLQYLMLLQQNIYFTIGITSCLFSQSLSQNPTDAQSQNYLKVIGNVCLDNGLVLCGWQVSFLQYLMPLQQKYISP